MREGSASVTAQRLAALRLLFDRAPADFGDPGSDDPLARDVAGTWRPDPVAPMARHLRARTAFFDRVVLAALGGGISQVVVVAAGYNGRSMRYALPGVRWFEVDHPDTQADKRARMVRLGLVAAATTYVPADFTRDDPGSLLVDAGFDRGRPAMVLAEGLAVYLEPAVLARLLRSLRAVAAPGSRLAISVSAALRDDSEQAAAEAQERRARFAAAVAAMGEPARAILPPDAAEEMLRAAGWEPVPTPESTPGLTPERVRAAGLLLAVAAPQQSQV